MSIFDGKWCSFAAFEQGCYDVATEKLNFSEEYRRKTVKEGPHDKRRKKNSKVRERLVVTTSGKSRYRLY